MVSDCMLIASLISALASLLLADRQAHQIRDADTEEAELALVDEEKEAKEEAELGVRCGQMVRVMAPIETALTNWAAYVEVRSPASDGHLMIPDGQLMTTDRQLMTPDCHLSPDLSASECAPPNRCLPPTKKILIPPSRRRCP